MGHRVRWYVTEVVHEVTIRTLGGAFWLRPDAACKAIIEGVFGKALRLYPGIRLYGYDAQSNHLHGAGPGGDAAVPGLCALEHRAADQPAAQA